jgi:hypothetical protein
MSNETARHPERLSGSNGIFDEALRAVHTDAAVATRPISLIKWKQRRAEMDNISDSAWLMQAYVRLKAAGFRLVFLAEDQADPFPINDNFYDIEVREGGEPNRHAFDGSPGSPSFLSRSSADRVARGEPWWE